MDATDLRRWRLKVCEGRQTWHYLRTDAEVAAWPQTTADKHHLDLLEHSTASGTDRTAIDAVRHAFAFAQSTLTADGHWAGDYGGPLFLMPGWVISCYVTGAMGSLTAEMRLEMKRYLFNQVKAQGGWGLHIEGKETMFGTALNYVVLRLLGVPADEPRMVQARAWVHSHGGATYIPAWGKFWLAVLNVYAWEGMNPLSPETWVLPYALPIHPGRYWCHCRQVYLPMSYIYGARIAAPATDPLVTALRQELYPEPYEAIDWPAARNKCAEPDNYCPHTLLCNALFGTHYVEYNLLNINNT